MESIIPKYVGLNALIASAIVCAGCGGGGGGDGTAAATPGASTTAVASTSIGTPKYGQSLLLTITGTRLDQPLKIGATGCAATPAVDATGGANTATTAHYSCVVSAVGAGQFTVQDGAGATLATQPFTVPPPMVTLTLGNGAALSGTVVLALNADKAPVTVANFLAYVNSGFYDGTVIHRVAPGFVIQGGGYTAPFNAQVQTLKPTNAPIALEVGKGLSNLQWTVAMARNADKNSATSQFFINLVDNSATLDPSALTDGYAVFGSVAAGVDTVTATVAAPCSAVPFFLADGECAPQPNVVIGSAVQTQ